MIRTITKGSGLFTDYEATDASIEGDFLVMFNWNYNAVVWGGVPEKLLVEAVRLENLEGFKRVLK